MAVAASFEIGRGYDPSGVTWVGVVKPTVALRLPPANGCHASDIKFAGGWHGLG